MSPAFLVAHVATHFCIEPASAPCSHVNVRPHVCHLSDGCAGSVLDTPDGSIRFRSVAAECLRSIRLVRTVRQRAVFCFFPHSFMATRSFIALQKPNGSLEGVYCHWDGYLNGNGQILFNHYRDPEKIAYLLSFGDISSLGSQIGDTHDFLDRGDLASTTFYGRDRGETKIEPRTFRTRKAMLKYAAALGCEFLYLYQPNGWWYADRGQQFFGMNDDEEFSEFSPLQFSVTV